MTNADYRRLLNGYYSSIAGDWQVALVDLAAWAPQALEDLLKQVGSAPIPILVPPSGPKIVSDAAIHLPPPVVIPAKGASYIDPVFGTSIKRITDALHTNNWHPSGPGAPLTWIENEYSTCCPFSCDNSWLLLLHEDHFGLYKGDTFVGDTDIAASSEPRWSRKNPNLFYFVEGNTLKTCDVSSYTKATARVFSEYAAITGKGKTDISYDDDHLIFIGDSLELFIYRISADSKTIIAQNHAPGWNNVFISPDNNAVISWLAAGAARYQGVEVYDKVGNFLRQIAYADGHSKMARDTNGDEVFIWTDSAVAGPFRKFSQQSIVKVRIADGAQTQLLAFDWSLACHISAADKDWAFVETYNPATPPDWKLYTDELLAIKLDGSEIRRLAHHRSRPFPGNTYNYMPKLSASRDGKKLVYASNFGIGTPVNYGDAYMMETGV